ncbi:MAG TPA: hypothetical protein VLB83_05245 [Candidatus Paceibacterota bacterium]|nr:hypothetical protein [Candidatus Paceibacterota bacterium]
MDTDILRRNPLPASIVLAVLIVGGGVLVLNKDRLFRGDTLPEAGPSAVTLAAAPTNENEEADTDKDGLPDWKEALYGSDLNDADTDKDGARDGDEVRSGRDPVKPAPNDNLNQFQDIRFATSDSDILGLKREFFAKFLAQRSAEIREVTLQEVVTKNLDVSKFQPRFQVVDMKVTSDSSVEALRKYGNDFGIIINRYSKVKYRSEQDILLDAMKTKSNETLRELQYPATSYLNFSKDLRAITVPMPLLKDHLRIVNAYDIMGRSLLALQELYTNPIQGAAGYEGYTKYRMDVITGYAGIIHVFGESDVVFAENEPGFPFYWNTVRFPPSNFKSTTTPRTGGDTMMSDIGL